MTTTPNMGLVLPDDGGSLNVWGGILNTIFSATKLDGHDHTTGKGVKVPSAALNVNAAVSWSSGGTSWPITDILALDFKPSDATLSGITSLAGALFVSDGAGGLSANELYWRTTTGSNVKVTAGTALNVAGFVGGIGGDYAAVGALVVFDDATDSYWFQQQVGSAVRQYARMRSADVDLYEFKANPAAGVPANRVRLASPAALAGSYALTFPGALPGGAAIVTIDSGGVITAATPTSQALTFGAATTFNVAATFSGNINANAEITHTSTYDICLPSSLFAAGSANAGPLTQITSGAPFGDGYFATRITSSGSSIVVCPVPGLRVGDRIVSVQVDVASVTGTQGAYTAALVTQRTGTSANTRGSQAGGSVSTSETQATATVGYTLVTGDNAHIEINSSDTNLYVTGARVRVTHP